jgi:cytidylate kinase
MADRGTAAPESTVVTLDGPAGSGKSTTAREVARRLGYRYLDSGALYRMITYALLEEGVESEQWPRLTPRELASLHVAAEAGEETLLLRHRGRLLGDAELRSEEVTELVSRVAGIPAVRNWLLDTQRALGREGRLVADGRDMGTVVFPAAGTKVFLEADLRERARRRLRDQGVDAPEPERVAEAADRLADRDSADSGREDAPLRVPEGAHRLDTTDLAFEEQVERVVALARGTAHQR